ncbi:MAG TPA: leucyl aminopeptidase family protein [Ignavibacteriales bacterium]|nr:leucyl aminopeptidase family protein [Ignavibacteriales bacterium]HOL80864.1 leucyl aminopeptidase family protein [Ignavibacteriales bacterium]HOM65890.1 leucyl aminopeptidase family protein [Ignavibacteriales bacterium]HPD67646.1 leucyl aminopeptidase family protein [Ignavibacteriales bacterium]HPP33299.1 leucyl aminopeptidase family protein [Ignavibacteriales bacterium]
MISFQFKYKTVKDTYEYLVYICDEKSINNKEIHIPEISFNYTFNNKEEIKNLLPIGIKRQLKVLSYANNDKYSVINGISNFISSINNDSNVIIYLNDFSKDKEFLRQLVEGIFLGSYKFDKYLSEKKEKNLIISFINLEEDKLKQLINISKVIYDCVKLARDLSNEIPDVLTPKSFVDTALSEIGKSYNKIQTEIYNYKKLQELGFNGILTVGKGSKNKPFLLVASYKGIENSDKFYALIGKGITFDSGGYSIKPYDSMPEMKADMSGAAVALATFLAVERLKLPINLKIYIPLAENLVSGSAYKPSDIIKMYNGKTVEVVNTDAEGRLILADALSFVSEQNPELIIDLATLTGAIVVALGMNYSGVFSNNNEYFDKLSDISKRTNEKIWQMPLAEEYSELLKSDIADMKNLGDRWGGAITASLFLKNFIKDGTKWIHIDLAGPSFPNQFGPNTKNTMTGYGVRLLTYFFMNLNNSDSLNISN